MKCKEMEGLGGFEVEEESGEDGVALNRLNCEEAPWGCGIEVGDHLTKGLWGGLGWVWGSAEA